MTRALLAIGMLGILVGCTKPDASPVVATSTDAGTSSAAAERARQREGEKLVADDCLMCHRSELLRQQRLTSAQWSKVVTKMGTWGSPIEPENASTLVAYLAENYGPDAGAYEPAVIPPEQALASLAPEDDGSFSGGDAKRGSALYLSTCSACHGMNARGQLGVNLVERPILYRASDVARMVHEGRGRMAPLPGVSDAQIADVLAYLRGLRGA